MQIFNETSFPCFVFESLDQHDHSIEVVFCRATFDLVDGVLVEAEDQQPVVLADVYRDQPLTSSVQVDTDLVPRKLTADITLNAVAHAPSGVPAERWPVSVRVGRVSKTITVTGPRNWQHSMLRGWHLSRPEPTTEVPLHYEYSFGGAYQVGDEQSVCEQNPVGRGFASSPHADLTTRIPAPQIEDPLDPIKEFGKVYSPVGLGPIAKHWLPRRALCGTADEQWKETRWPLRPLDFDFHYYNSAPPGLVYPGFLRGDEDVLLTGLSAQGPITFSLPGSQLVLFGMDQRQQITLESMLLDTLHIDTVTNKVYLTWRLTLLKTAGLARIQIVQQPLEKSLTSKPWETIHG